MRLPLFFAKRYLLSKKSHNLINVISMISVGGLAIGTMALIVVLSVFNGFEEVIKSLYNTFNPDIQVTAVTGKTFHYTAFPSDKIAQLEEVANLIEVVEEDALLRYNEQQYIARFKGVPKTFQQFSSVDSMMIDGTFILQEGETNFAIPGAGVAWHLDINPNNPLHLLTIYVPKRGNASSFQFNTAFNSGSLHPAGIFSIQQEFDERYVFVPLRFARKLMDYTDEVTSVEIMLKPVSDPEKAQAHISKILGDGFVVKSRLEQNESLFKILKSEKTIIYLILVFILLLSSFNMIGSLSILMIEKNKDMAVLNSLGATRRMISRIFLTEGVLITAAGSMAGLLLGYAILLLQQQFGLLSLGNGEGAFIIDAYPVKMNLTDFFLVFLTVQCIGLFATWYPVKLLTPKITRRNLK
ncbi:MAG: FtsX-like permease family protein [Bacteroidales bacterium]|jgi:lipoprotein-releasing system permease protein